MTRPGTGSLADWLSLCRAPLVVTAISNSVTAAVVSFHDVCHGVDPAPVPLRHGPFLQQSTLLLLTVASACAYLAGMALNDFFDRERDCTLHPERPLPGGRIRPSHAATVASLLLVMAVAAAGAVGLEVAGAALALVGCILAYNALLKRWVGPGALAMGSCRFCNALMGAVAGWVMLGWSLRAGGVGPVGYLAGFRESALAGDVPQALAMVHPFLAPLAVGAFVTLLTLISTLEERTCSPRTLVPLTLGLALVALATMAASHEPLFAAPFCVPLACGAVWLGVSAARLENPQAGIGAIMRWMLRGLLLLDAGILAGSDLWRWAPMPLTLMVPFWLLARKLSPPKAAPGGS